MRHAVHRRRDIGWLYALALAALAAGLLLATTVASAADGYWVLDSVKLWRFEAHPNPPPPRPNRYAQDVKASGIAFDVVVTDVDNKQHPHHLRMGWTILDAGNGVVIPAGHEVRIAISGQHAGDYYRSADFQVRAGDFPRTHPAGWRTTTDTYPAWGFRTDAVLTVQASNGAKRGETKVKFPPAAIAGGEPFALLFHTGIAGSAGVEYLYHWSGTAPTAPPRATLPPEVVGARAAASPTPGTNDTASRPVSKPPSTQPAGGPPTSATGAERKAILDSLRPWVQDELRQPVEFVVSKIVTTGAWAFVIATPQRPGGGALRWQGTPCAGDVSHLVGGLLRRQGSGWSLVATALCPTDVAWADWPQTHGAPASLFE